MQDHSGKDPEAYRKYKPISDGRPYRHNDMNLCVNVPLSCLYHKPSGEKCNGKLALYDRYDDRIHTSAELEDIDGVYTLRPCDVVLISKCEECGQGVYLTFNVPSEQVGQSVSSEERKMRGSGC